MWEGYLGAYDVPGAARAVYRSCRHLVLSGRLGLTATRGCSPRARHRPPPPRPASYRVGMSNGSYGEGERVLGPPQGGTWAGMATAGMEEALLP